MAFFRYECLNSCFTAMLCIGFFMMAAGIALTAVGGSARKKDDMFSISSSTYDPIGDYNAETAGYSQSNVDSLDPSGAQIWANPNGGSTGAWAFVGFEKQNRSVSLVGEISRITGPNPTTSYLLRSTSNYPASAVANPADIASATLTFSIANVDASTPSYTYYIPTIALSQKLSRGSFVCGRSGGCYSSDGQSYCTSTYGSGAQYTAPSSGFPCNNYYSCGSCYVRQFLDCFAVVLQKTPSGVPTTYSAPTKSDLLSCQFSNSFVYKTVLNTSAPVTVTAIVILESDPYYNAYRYSSSRSSSPFTMVDQKASSDADEDDKYNAKRKLLIPGVLFLVLGIFIMVVGLVGVTCARECCFCMFGEAVIDPSSHCQAAQQQVVVMPMTTVSYAPTVAVAQQLPMTQQQTYSYNPPPPTQPPGMMNQAYQHTQQQPYSPYGHQQQQQHQQWAGQQQQQGVLHTPQHYQNNNGYGYAGAVEMQHLPPYAQQQPQHYQGHPAPQQQMAYSNSNPTVQFTSAPGKTL